MDAVPTWAAVVLAGGSGRRLGGPGKPTLPVAGVPMLDRVLAAVAHAGVRVVVGPSGLALPAGVDRTREEPPGGGPVAALAAGLAALDHPGRPAPEVVAVLAADLPLLTAAAVDELRTALACPGPPGAGAVTPAAPAYPGPDPGGHRPAPAPQSCTVDGALYVDGDGRWQYLCGVWRLAALRVRLDSLACERGSLDGAALRDLLRGLRVVEVGPDLRARPAGAPRPGARGRHGGPPRPDGSTVLPPLTSSPRPPAPPWYDCDTTADLRHVQELIMESVLAEWVDEVRTRLGLDPIDPAVVLDLARDVAHGVTRPAAPVTAYLLGLAVGRGADPVATARVVSDLATGWAARTVPAAGARPPGKDR